MCKDCSFGRQNVEEMGESICYRNAHCLIVRGQNTLFFERPSFSLPNPD